MTTKTIKNLGMLVPSQNKQPELARLLARLRNKPFFCGQPVTCNGEFCFWHNFPVYRHGKQMPCLKYELDILSKFDKSSYHIILKPVSAGITTMCLYWLVYKAVVNDDWKNRSVGIIVGPNISLAIKLMKRIRKMFEPYNIFWETKETYSVIGQTEFEVFPSHHLDSYRSLESPVCTYISEAEMFPSHQVSDVREVSERYISKAGGRPYWIIMESTPGSPNGLFDTMFREEPSIYTKTKFDYTVPLAEGMYSQSEIDIALKSPSADRELLCRFAGFQGSSFKITDIQRCQEIKYNPDEIMPNITRSLGCDMGYTGGLNGGAFSFCVVEDTGNVIKVMYSEEFQNAEHSAMVQKAVELMNKYNVVKVWADASGVDFIRSLKTEISEDPNYHRVFERAKHDKIPDPFNLMTICPISFSTEHKIMMSHCKALLSDGLVAIDSGFAKLITAISTATDLDNSYQKHNSQCLHTDSFDSFRLAVNPHMFSFG